MRINDGLTDARIVPVASVHVDPSNVRTHSERNLEAIKNSLAKFGQQRSIVVDTDMTVIAGNGTLQAAIALGATEIAVTVFDGDSKTFAAAYAIADNRTGELASWDFEALKETIDALAADNFDVISLGWDKDEMHNLMMSEFVPPDNAPLPEPADRGGQPIRLTPLQRELFDRCATAIRESEGDATMSDGDVLEAVARAWLAANNQ